MSIYEREIGVHIHLAVSDPPLSQQIDSDLAHVIVDNWSNQYLELLDAGSGNGRFVGPGDHGGVYPLRSTTLARAQWAAPPGFFQPPNPIGSADLVFLGPEVEVVPQAPTAGQIVSQQPAHFLTSIGPNDNTVHTVPLPAGTRTIIGFCGNGAPTALPAVTSTAHQGVVYMPFPMLNVVFGQTPQGFPVIWGPDVAYDETALFIQVADAHQWTFFASSLGLVSGAAQIAKWIVQSNLFDSNGSGIILGQQPSALSLPVTLSSDQSVNLGPTSVKAINAAVGAGAFVSVIAGVGGQDIYLSNGSLAASAAPGRLGVSQSGSAADVFLEFVGASTPLPIPLGGAKVTQAQGHSIYVYSDNAVTVNGFLAYTQK